MSVLQEIVIDDLSQEELLELEQQAHDAVTPWVNAHTDTSEADLVDIGYNRINRVRFHDTSPKRYNFRKRKHGRANKTLSNWNI